jgi:ABC-type glycerol-3-phosphate transport system substrate-binding protein
MKSQTLKKTIGLLAVALLASTALIGCGKSASKSSQGNDKAVTFWVNCSDKNT